MSLICPNMYLLKQKRPIRKPKSQDWFLLAGFLFRDYLQRVLYHSFLIMPVLGKYFFGVSHSLFYYSRKTGPAGPPLAHCTVVVLSLHLDPISGCATVRASNQMDGVRNAGESFANCQVHQVHVHFKLGGTAWGCWTGSGVDCGQGYASCFCRQRPVILSASAGFYGWYGYFHDSHQCLLS